MNLPYHGKYEWLSTLYDIIKNFKPKKIVEFGPGRGQTTITMALALKELGDGKINSYDLWVDEYWGDKEDCLNEFKTWNVDNLITLEHLDFYDWIKLPIDERDFDIEVQIAGVSNEDVEEWAFSEEAEELESSYNYDVQLRIVENWREYMKENISLDIKVGDVLLGG